MLQDYCFIRGSFTIFRIMNKPALMVRYVAALAFFSTVLVIGASASFAADAPATQVTWKKIHLADEFYAEGAAFGDFNHDGQQDVTAGGFWWEGPDFKIKHQFADYPKIDPHTYSNDFLTFTCSFKNDGWDDIIIVGYPGKETYWYENPRARATGSGLNTSGFAETDDESPVFSDLFKNGKPVLVCGSEGTNPGRRPARICPAGLF